MSQGSAPATKATMTVTKAMIRDTPLIGGMSAGLRVVLLVVFLVFLLLGFPLLTGFLPMEFLLELLLLMMLVLLRGEPFSRCRKFASSPQFLGSSPQLPFVET
jgi:hypothetical protein